MSRRSAKSCLGGLLVLSGTASVILSYPMHHFLPMLIGGLAAAGIGMLIS